MKRIILLSAIALLVSTLLNGQGTLQFNQVKLVSTVQTVPVGKVWKVESVMASSDLSVASGMTSGTSSYNASNSTQIVVDGVTCYISQNNGWIGPNSGSSANPRHYGEASANPSILPCWLPAGTTLAAGSNVSKISVIEYNVIP